MTIAELKRINDQEQWRAALTSEALKIGLNAWPAFKKRCHAAGMPIDRYDWLCPVCKAKWRECDHPLVPYWDKTAAYPHWPDRPWKDESQ